MLTTSVEARLQAVDAPIMRQLKEVVLLIKGGMPLGGDPVIPALYDFNNSALAQLALRGAWRQAR